MEKRENIQKSSILLLWLQAIIWFYKKNIETLWESLMDYCKWLYVNLQLQFFTRWKKVVFAKEICMINFGVRVGSEYQWIRPAVVLSNRKINATSMCIVVPITSYSEGKTIFVGDVVIVDRKESWLMKESIAKVSHIQTIDKKRCIKKIWVIPDAIFQKIQNNVYNCI